MFFFMLFLIKTIKDLSLIKRKSEMEIEKHKSKLLGNIIFRKFKYFKFFFFFLKETEHALRELELELIQTKMQLAQTRATADQFESQVLKILIFNF